MDNKIPTIEALDAAFSAHYESMTREDRREQITWFLDAIEQSKLLEREIYATIDRMCKYMDPEKEQFCVKPEDLTQWIMQISAKFFFIGWNARGAIEDDERLRNLR